ncbi:MAG: Multiple RNA-binding domain-containing protein 1 [Thelocarpon superellum]|nr:MAG: Multiple RNA-binding domain-containing protein 1 [Thelocarpon superellum]
MLGSSVENMPASIQEAPATASSRIFIRGLPPTLSDEDFRKHFAVHQPVTDAKLIPHRRIGYVGYKTAEDAMRAVKYFNKSFIRMSRIAVEVARPVADVRARRSFSTLDSDKGIRRHSHQASEGASQGVKRKRDGSLKVAEKEKLEEFLDVMQPSSRSRTWADDRFPQEEPSERRPSIGATDDVEDDSFDHVLPRSKRGDPQTLDCEPDSKLLDVVQAESLLLEHADTALAAPPPVSGSSDAEWLRSRTNQRLGLGGDAVGVDSGNSVITTTDAFTTSLKGGHDTHTRSAEPNEDSEKASDPQDADEMEIDPITSTGRLFLRNLPYGASEADLRAHFSSYGSLHEVHLPRDRSGSSKGFAYVQYDDSKHALEAYRALDGEIFQGRLIHIIPAVPKKESKVDEFALSQLPLKKQRYVRKKMEAASSTFNWNAMYMNANAVMSSVADRLGVAKSELLDSTSSDAAVKQAHSETHIIQETKAYFAANGVNLEAFRYEERGDGAILVKNFPYGTTADELKGLFEAYGSVSRVLMPPAGTIAIVQYPNAVDLRAAFGHLAYRRFKDSILFLEKAPKGVFEEQGKQSALAEAVGVTSKPKASTALLFDGDGLPQATDAVTLFVRNLNFSTTTERLKEIFRPLEGFMSARVKTKRDPKRPGETLSMGFGFVEFRTSAQAQAARVVMNDYCLDGHQLLVRASHKALDAAEERGREERAKQVAGRRTKIIIKNLPFEVSKKEVRALFGAYGQLRSVRVPKKFDSSARGFAFADFVSAREAENAMDALGETHLLGRRLVLEFAAEDAVDAEEEIEKMQRKVGRQVNQVALQRLAGAGRKKFAVEGAEDSE